MSTLTEEYRLGNIVRDIMEAAELNPEELDRDLNVLFQLSTALVKCYKGAFDAQGNVRTQQPSRELDIITFHPFVGNGIQTVFPLVNEIDVATELIGFVKLDAVRIFTPTDYTFSSTDLTIPVPPANGAVGEYAIVQNTAGVIDRIEAITAGLGAYLIGYPDDNNLYQASTAGGALDEVMSNLNQLVTDLGLLSGLLRNDGSVQLVANWEINLRKENGTAKAATGTIDVIGTPVHLDTFTIFDGIIGVGNTFQFTAPVLNAAGSLEFTGVPAAGDTVTLIDAEGTSITFEYYLNGGADNTAPANTGVQLGVDAAGTESSFRTAVGVSVLKITGTLNISAPNPTTDLAQDLPGTAGNTTITIVGANMTASNSIGGLDETNPSFIPVVIGVLFTDTAANITTTVNESALAVTATNPTPPNARVNIIHDLSSATGNRLISQSGVSLTISGLGGGQNGLLGDLCASQRIRNSPVSVRDGDVVVHEQLQSLLAVIQTFAELFLLLDGSSIMNGRLRMGGNKIIDIADGVDDKDAVNKGQLNLIENLLVRFIPTMGAADPDYAAASQDIGPLSFGRAASEVATTPQDSGAGIATFSGVPIPGAPDHVVNKQHLDDQTAILQSQISNIGSGSGGSGGNPDGSVTVGSSLGGCANDGVGVGSVGDINSGGVYNFESFTNVVGQTPTEDTFIFVSGDVLIQGDIDAGRYRLEISATGSITVDETFTLTGRNVILRSGADITINGSIDAKGWTRFESTVNAEGFNTNFGYEGFCYMSAIGAVNTGGSCNIEAFYISVFAGATSIMSGTFRAKGAVYSAGSENESGSQTNNVAEAGNTFRNFSVTSNFENHFDVLTDSGRNETPAIFAGTAGLGGVFHHHTSVGSNWTVGSGGGGAGGTGGGNGGDGSLTGKTRDFGSFGSVGVHGFGGTARNTNSFKRYLLPRHPGGGGGGGGGGQANYGGSGGGCIIIFVRGDLTATGLILNANGQKQQGGDAGFQKAEAGSGGGGSLRCVVNGNLHDLSASADGGSDTSFSGGGGGGGGNSLVAITYSGTQTQTSAKGDGDSGADGSAGTVDKVLLTAEEITCYEGEGYWAK